MLQAHDSSVSSFDINAVIPGLMVTGSTDKQVKIWNITDNKPSMVLSRKLEVGKVFSTVFAPDQEVSFRLAVAGSKGVVTIWDTSTNGAVRRAFASRLGRSDADQGEEVRERMVGLVNDDDDDSDGDEEEAVAGAQGESAGPPRDGWESMDED
jgi:periodic tryptophan protein 1